MRLVTLHKKIISATLATVILTACGGGGGDDSTSAPPVTTTPTPTNIAPTIDAMPTQEVFERDSFTFEPSVSDSDGSVVEYKWEQISGITIDNGFVDSMSSLNFLAPELTEAQTVVFKLTITDNDRATASANVEINLQAYDLASSLTFPDAGLTACINSDTYKESDIGLLELYCDSYNISSLEGIEQLTDLVQVSFANNELTDISPLTELSDLYALTLDNNQVQEIAAVENFSRLTILKLENNPVSDISAIKALTNLEMLSLSDTNIDSLTALTDLSNLKFLTLLNTQVEDLAPIAGLTNLESLIMFHAPIKSVAPLKNLTNLKSLWLGHNESSFIEDLSPLSGLINLEQLSVFNRSATNVDFLTNLTNLTELLLHVTQATDTSPLHNLTKLKRLDIGGYTLPFSAWQAKFSDMSFLSKLTNLENISIRRTPAADITGISVAQQLNFFTCEYCHLTDISSLSELTLLTVVQLHIEQGGITSLEPLKGLNNLTALYVKDGGSKLTDQGDSFVYIELDEVNTFTDINVLTTKPLEYLSLNGEVIDISLLSEFTEIKGLDLSNNQISSISALSPLTKVEHLGLDGNQLSSIDALSSLTNLKGLALFDNLLTTESLQPLSGLTELTNLNLSDNQITSLESLSLLTNLVELNVRKNALVSVSSLNALTNLGYLLLMGNNNIPCTELDNLPFAIERPELCIAP